MWWCRKDFAKCVSSTSTFHTQLQPYGVLLTASFTGFHHTIQTKRQTFTTFQDVGERGLQKQLCWPFPAVSLSAQSPHKKETFKVFRLQTSLLRVSELSLRHADDRCLIQPAIPIIVFVFPRSVQLKQGQILFLFRH